MFSKVAINNNLVSTLKTRQWINIKLTTLINVEKMAQLTRWNTAWNFSVGSTLNLGQCFNVES